MREQTCCFTGHRQIPQGEQAEIIARLERTIINLNQKGVRFYGAGGALGFDYEKRKVMRSEVLDTAQESGEERNHFA